MTVATADNFDLNSELAFDKIDNIVKGINDNHIDYFLQVQNINDNKYLIATAQENWETPRIYATPEDFIRDWGDNLISDCYYLDSIFLTVRQYIVITKYLGN